MWRGENLDLITQVVLLWSNFLAWIFMPVCPVLLIYPVPLWEAIISLFSLAAECSAHINFFCCRCCFFKLIAFYFLLFLEGFCLELILWGVEAVIREWMHCLAVVAAFAISDQHIAELLFPHFSPPVTNVKWCIPYILISLSQAPTY